MHLRNTGGKHLYIAKVPDAFVPYTQRAVFAKLRVWVRPELVP